ncbi:MAG: histidine phosphatase family protein [Acidimicrobiales bacterium]
MSNQPGAASKVYQELVSQQPVQEQPVQEAVRQELPTRLVLVRHGESACSVDKIVGGIKGCTGLSAKGAGQARALAARLAATAELAGTAAEIAGPVALYSSVLPRAVQTAALIAPGLGRPGVTEDCDLCELHPGEADGLTWETAESVYGPLPDFSVDPETPLSPGGESWVSFCERVEHALLGLVGRHRGRTIVVACHGGLIDASLQLFGGMARRGSALAATGARSGLSRARLFTENTSITEWRITGPDAGQGAWRLVRYNDFAHLLGGWRAGG